MHLFQRFVDRLTRRIPRSLDTLDEGLPDLETHFTQRDLHQAALETERAAWLVALPDDVHALLDGKQPHDLDFIRAGAALTPPSDGVNAVRRWVTLPDMLEYPAPTTTIAERVAYLFATQPRPDGQEYGYEELAVAFDGQLNPNEVAQLRAGTIPDDQVSLRTIFQISRFFYVSPQYFYPVMMICSRNGSSLAAHARRMDEELIMALLRRPLPAGPDLPPGSVPWGQHAHMFVDTARSPRTTLQE